MNDNPSPQSHKRVEFYKLYSHPLAQSFHDLTQQIERLGASPELTAVVVAVQSLKSEVEAEINRLLQNAASDAALLTRYHEWCGQHDCAPSTSDLYAAPSSETADAIAAKDAEVETLRSTTQSDQALIERLREALQCLESACEQLSATRSLEIYTAMIEGGQTEALLSLDARRKAARAILAETEHNP